MVREKRAVAVGQAHGDEEPRASEPVAKLSERAAPPPRRWSAQKKRDIVLRLLRGEPLDAMSRETGVEIYRLEDWKTRALAGMETGLREREERGQAELDAAMKRIGELTMENELLRVRVEKKGPFVWKRSRP